MLILCLENIFAESERWYYWTDRLGLLVWQDFPSISNMAKIEQEDKENFEREYTRLELHNNFRESKRHCVSRWMEQRGNHPSIILWVVFNEAWGQFDTVEVPRR